MARNILQGGTFDVNISDRECHSGYFSPLTFENEVARDPAKMSSGVPSLGSPLLGDPGVDWLAQLAAEPSEKFRPHQLSHGDLKPIERTWQPQPRTLCHQLPQAALCQMGVNYLRLGIQVQQVPESRQQRHECRQSIGLPSGRVVLATAWPVGPGDLTCA